jgi:hypothetical protein
METVQTQVETPVNVLGGKKPTGAKGRYQEAVAKSQQKEATKPAAQPTLKPEVKLEVPTVAGDVSFSPAQLQAIQSIVAAVLKSAETQNSETATKLVDAILESRKPYVDPSKAAFDKMTQEQNKEVQARMKDAMARARESCAHLQGSHELSSFSSPYGLSSIIKHKLDTNEFIGICSNCGRIFRDTDPDYKTWMSKKSGNLPSRSGDRTFFNQREVINRGR